LGQELVAVKEPHVMSHLYLHEAEQPAPTTLAKGMLESSQNLYEKITSNSGTNVLISFPAVISFVDRSNNGLDGVRFVLCAGLAV
jgi:hypothetical protein